MKLTASEIEALWSVIGKIGTVIAFIVGLVKGSQFIFSLTPTSRLAVRVTKCEALLEKDYQHFERIDAEIAEIKKGQKSYEAELCKAVNGINKIGTSQISLLRHMADGNGIDEMRAEAEELTEFFIIKN